MRHRCLIAKPVKAQAGSGSEIGLIRPTLCLTFAMIVMEAGMLMTKMKLIPISLKEASQFVHEYHRHNKPLKFHKFSIGVKFDDVLVGVVIVGRPVARSMDDGVTAEVSRLCVNENAPKNACSFLYGAAWRAWRAMGGQRIITYTLQSENGASLRGAGWKILHQTAERNNSGWTNRIGRDWQPASNQAKFCWITNDPADA